MIRTARPNVNASPAAPHGSRAPSGACGDRPTYRALSTSSIDALVPRPFTCMTLIEIDLEPFRITLSLLHRSGCVACDTSSVHACRPSWTKLATASYTDSAKDEPASPVAILPQVFWTTTSRPSLKLSEPRIIGETLDWTKNQPGEASLSRYAEPSLSDTSARVIPRVSCVPRTIDSRTFPSRACEYPTGAP